MIEKYDTHFYVGTIHDLLIAACRFLGDSQSSIRLLPQFKIASHDKEFAANPHHRNSVLLNYFAEMSAGITRMSGRT